MKKITHTYYWWYRMMITTLAIAINVFFIGIFIDVYTSIGLSFAKISSFLFVGLLMISLMLATLLYCLHVCTYRLTVRKEGLSKRSIFGSSSIPYGDIILEQYGIFGIFLKSAKNDAFISISHLVSKSSQLLHNLDDDPAALYCPFEHLVNDSEHSAPPLAEYKIAQQTSIIVPALGIFCFLYGVPNVLAELFPPYVHVLIYITVLFLSFSVWDKVNHLNYIFFSEIVDQATNFIIGINIMWLLSQILGLFSKYDMKYPGILFIASIIIGGIVYFLPWIRNFIANEVDRCKKLYWFFVLLLPLSVFNLTGLINCLPSNNYYTVEKPILDKTYLRGMFPRFILSVSMWNKDETDILTKFQVFEEIEIGDTVFLDIHHGLLGLPWIHSTYLGPQRDSLRYTKKMP